MKKILAFVLIIQAFIAPQLVVAQTDEQVKIIKAVFAGGCFWCMEKPFDDLEGVIDTKSGYSGGTQATATYKQVVSGKTKHIEAVEVTYDANIISYTTLLKTYWINIDPFDETGQFCDKGKQYIAAIFPKNTDERELAINSKSEMQELLGKKIVTKITDFISFYPAEDYHQDYYKKNPIRYKFYRSRCGRDKRLNEVWAN